jgi:hypothetical protein
MRVLTSIEFLDGSTKAFETPLVQATQLNEPDRHAVAFQFDVPLSAFKPGQYTCQINVIDDTAGSFSFPRTAILIHAPATAGAPAPPPPPEKPGTGD